MSPKLRLSMALAAALAFAAPALAQAPAPALDRGQVEGIVRDYLLKNPEIIREAITALEERQRESEKVAQAKAFGDNREAIYNDPNAIVVGNPAGDVTLVEFFDYNCGYCKRSVLDVRELIKADPKLRIVLRDFPILGPDSIEASKVAVAAKSQLKGEKLWDFHLKLMSTRGKVGRERALEVAKEMGLDLAKLSAEAGNPAVMAPIQKTMELADSLGLNGTPVFIAGDEVISGAVGVEPLRKAIASVRQCGKATCA